MAPELKAYEKKSYTHKGYESEQQLKDEQAKRNKYQRKTKMKEVYETIKELRGEAIIRSGFIGSAGANKHGCRLLF